MFSLSLTNSLLKHEIIVYREEKGKNSKKKKSQKIKKEFIFPQDYGEKLSESTTTLGQLDILELEL